MEVFPSSCALASMAKTPLVTISSPSRKPFIALSGFRAFLKRKNIEISLRRYGIDALGAMAQGLFCYLLIGTILNTLGSQTGVAIFSTVGGYATAVSGPAMAVAIGYALKCPPLVLFSMVPVGWAANALGGSAGGPLAVFVIAIVAAEVGKMVSKETPVGLKVKRKFILQVVKLVKRLPLYHK